MPRAKERDGVYTRDDRPGWWISYVDEYGKRRQKKTNGSTLTQARNILNEEKERIRKAKGALARGVILATEDTFSEVAKRYLDFQKKRFAFATPRSSCRQALMLSRWLAADARAGWAGAKARQDRHARRR
jgi:hypothetical protein